MKKIKEWLMESNRYKHALGMYFVAGISLLSLYAFDLSVMVCIINATITCFLVGAAIEDTNRRAGGKFDWNDMLANGIGLVGAVVTLIVTLALTSIN